MATAMTFAAIVMSQVGAVFGCRTERISVFKIGLRSNKLILIGIAVEFALLGLLVYLPIPFLHDLFNTAPLGWREWAFLIVIPPAMLLIDEIRKWILRKWDRTKANRIVTERTVL